MAILTFPSTSRSQTLAILWLSLVVLVAVLAPILPLPYLPGVPDLAHVAQPPSGASRHWLGTDPQGRDVLSIIIFGARTALLLTVPAAVLSALLGALAGGAAGFWGNDSRAPVSIWLLLLGGGWWALRLPGPALGLVPVALGCGIELVARLRKRSSYTWPMPVSAAVMGVATALDTIPRLVLVVALTAGTGVSGPGLLALFILTSWSHPARLVRAQMLRIRSLPFIEAAQMAGLPAWRVWLYHALPHALHPLRTAFPLSLAGLLALESTLSFLGIGLPPEVASWGRLLATARNEPNAWWLFAFPGICLVTTILSLNSLVRQRSLTA